MRIRLVLFALALPLAGCGVDKPTLIAGDTPADIDVLRSESGSVADDSSPVDVGPMTTTPSDVTLDENPLLRLLDDDGGSAMIGSASFVLVDNSDRSIPSGSTDFPEFLVRIEAWYGVNNYIEYTMSYANVALVDGQRERFQCGNTWAGLAQTGSDIFQHTPNKLPEVKETTLVWPSSGCVEDLPIDFASLFENEVAIEVNDTGFLVSQLDMSEVPARFEKLTTE